MENYVKKDEDKCGLCRTMIYLRKCKIEKEKKKKDEFNQRKTQGLNEDSLKINR